MKASGYAIGGTNAINCSLVQPTGLFANITESADTSVNRKQHRICEEDEGRSVCTDRMTPNDIETNIEAYLRE